ncbi:SGNH/GDSL hydrolase family protein, partial [Bacillus paranthracis]
VMTTNKLLGKLIATFGDSITWLDGKVIAEVGPEPLVGYQSYMRKAGAIVDNFGHSGATIARSGISGVGCILDDIKAQDVTKYEIITIAGGTNDVGQNVNFGVVGVEEDTTFDETTTFGALRAAIEYIRSKNPKCRIYISTPIR